MLYAVLIYGQVVNRDTAVGIFKKNVERKPVDRDHRQMCKFSGARDEIFYRKVGPSIRVFVEKTSVESTIMLSAIVRPGENARVDSMQDNHLHLAQNRALAIADGINVQARQFHPDEQGSRDMELGAFGTSAYTPSASTVVNQLMLVNFSVNFQEIRHPLPGTCDWILGKDIFKRWCQDNQDSILFIRGGQGLGKSVLSNFIAQYLSNTRHDDTVLVVPFYCKTAGRQSTPESILRHVLYHLCQKFPAELSSFAHQQTQLLGTELTFGFYWALFVQISKVATFELLCIVDGLDECITDVNDEAERSINTVLVEFLEGLCQKFKGNDNGRPSKVKVLFTTRPIKEVAQVTERFGGLVFDIRSSDLISGVEKMIDTDVRELVTAKNLSSEIEDLIKTQLKSKAGPMYQWAHSVLRKLWGLTFSANALEVYQNTLERFIPDDIDNPYYETLRSIQEDATITTADKLMVVNLLRLVVFAEMDLDIGDLEYAIACAQVDCSNENFRSYLPVALLNRIQGSCGALLLVEDGIVRLAHQSVRDFLLHRVPAELSDFSCKDFQSCHSFVARLCLNYLMLWHSLEAPQLAPDASEVDKFCELVNLPFVWYASSFWDLHIRESGDPKSLWVLLQEFLRYDDFRSMQIARRCYTTDYDDPEGYPPISVFLASVDLVEVLKYCKLGHDGRRVGCFRRLKSRKAPKKEISIDVEERDQDGMTMFHWAVRNGSLDLVNMLLKHGAHGDVWDKDGDTPFSLAVASNHERLALALRDKGQLYMESHSDKRISTLQFTACHGMLSLLRYLLDQRALVDDDTGLLGWTPLYVASEYCHHHIVKLLLDRGANPNKRSRDGTTPLHATARKGSLPIVLELLKAPNMDAAPVDEDGQTPLAVAASKGYYEVFKELLIREPRVAADKEGWLPVHEAAANGHTAIVRSCAKEDLSARTKFRSTPLHIAAAHGHPEIVRYLLGQGVDINAKCEDQLARKDATRGEIERVTAIMIAVERERKDVVDILLESGADLHGTFSDRRNILHSAAASGNLKLVDRLLALDFDPFAKDIDGLTPLHLAARTGEDVIVDKYLQDFRGNDSFEVDGEDFAGLTPFLLAAAKGSISTMEILEKARADIHHCSPVFSSALHIASGLSEDAALRKLLAWNLDDTVPDRFGDSLMHEAAYAGIVGNLEILASRGRDVNAQSITGDTPLLYAAARKKEAAVDTLLKLGADPTIRDGCGLSAFDYFIERHPIWSILQPRRPDAAPTTEADRGLLVKATIRRLFNHIDSVGELHPSSRWRDYVTLAYQFLRVPDYAATKILMEAELDRLHDGRVAAKLECSKCEKNLLEWPLHICRNCYSERLCNPCYLGRADSGYASGCPAGHTYLEYGDREWWDLPRGHVNNAGETMDPWLASVKAQYVTEHGS